VVTATAYKAGCGVGRISSAGKEFSRGVTLIRLRTPKVLSLIQTIRQLRTTRSFAVISLNVLGMDVGSVTSMGTPSGEMLTIMHRVLNPM
jgi:hypothetical protein